MLKVEKIHKFAYFLNDDCFITMGSDKTFKIVNKNNGEYLTSFGEHENFEENLIISNDKKYIFISYDRPPMIRMYEVSTGKCLKTFIEEGEYNERVEAIEFDDKNNLLIYARNLHLKVWDIDSGKCVKDIYTRDENDRELFRSLRNGEINSISINNDSTILSTTGEDGRLLIWDLNTFKILEKEYFYNFGLNYDCLYDIFMWDYELTGLCKFSITNEIVYSNPFKNYFEIFNIKNKQIKNLYPEISHSKSYSPVVCFMETNLRKDILITNHVFNYNKSVLKKWNLTTEKMINEIDLGAVANIQSISFNSNETEILVSNYNGVDLYDANSGKLLKKFY